MILIMKQRNHYKKMHLSNKLVIIIIYIFFITHLQRDTYWWPWCTLYNFGSTEMCLVNGCVIVDRRQ